MCLLLQLCISNYQCLLQGAAANAETQDLQQQVLESGRFCSTAYKELLEQVGLVSIKKFKISEPN